MTEADRRERQRLYTQRYRDKNRDAINAKRRAARANADVKAKQADQQRALEAEIRNKVFAHYGGQCACCGATDRLSIDHVEGNGVHHRLQVFGPKNPQHVSPARFYAWLVREGFPPGFQTLCRPCNSSKAGGSHCRLWHGDPSLARCTRCGQVKPLGEFSPMQHKANGRQSWCRSCVNEYRKER